MSLTKEMIERECHRKDASDRMTIYLHKEGAFWRAYEWSAWLCCRYLNDFKVTRRNNKSVGSAVAYIGFPQTSIGKWQPEGSRTIQLSDSETNIVLALDEADAGEDVMRKAYEDWLSSIPVAEHEEREKPQNNNQSAPSMTKIMQQIMAFPIEKKSPLDSMLFLADIKQQLARFI